MENGGTPLCPICRTPLFTPTPTNPNGGNNVGNGIVGEGVHAAGGIRRRRRRARVARDPAAHRLVVSQLFADCPK